jgi:hypothetical protein
VDAAHRSHNACSSASSPLSGLAEGVCLGSRDDDFKLLLSAEALVRVVGRAAYASIEAALGDAPDAIALRRTEATGRWISWHNDVAGRTVQVPLSDDSACVGGRLLMIASGMLVSVTRRAGNLLVFDGDVVHGVTRLSAGVRHGLFAMKARMAAQPA